MTEQVKFPAFFRGVTEFERGWGDRPDGYLVAKDEASFYKRAAEINSQQGDEFSRTNGAEPRPCWVTEVMHNKLQASEDGTVWTANEVSWYIIDREPDPLPAVE